MKKRILIVTSNFTPEDSGISVYSTDLALNALSKNYDVHILTGLPHYPWWRKLPQFSHILPGLSMINNVKVTRINHAIPGSKNALSRIYFEASFWINGLRVLRNQNMGKFDLVIAIMPTVSSGLLARFIAKNQAISGIVVFQDITHLAAKQSGMPLSSYFCKLIFLVEKEATRWASTVIVVSEEMKKIVEDLKSQTARVLLIHNYSVLEKPSLSKESARDLNKTLPSKFLVLHTGNIGYKQNIENIVKAAKILESETDILFQIIGHGNQEEKLKALINGATNIEWRPFVNKSDYANLLESSDLLLVNERASVREMCLPSKLTAYMAAGKPIIAAVSEQSSTAKFVLDIALIVEPENPKLLAKAVLGMKNDKQMCSDFGNKSKHFAKKHMSLEIGRGNYLNAINEMFL